MRSKIRIIVAFILSQQVSALDLRMDIAGGTCHNVTEFDDTFAEGIMPGAEELVQLTTITQDEDMEIKYGFSVIQGGTNSNSTTESAQHQDDRDLLLVSFDCPTYNECPGMGNPYHWCAWMCGYWFQRPTHLTGRRRPERGGFFRRIMEDLQLTEDEVAPVAEFELRPIEYTSEDRELRLSIEGLVCGWIQKWMDSRFSRCLQGATLMTCELDLF